MSKIFQLAYSVLTVLFSTCGQTNSSSSKTNFTSSDMIKINVGKAPGSVEVIPHTHGIATGDINNDGNTDIITTNLEGDNVTILLGDGKGNFNDATGSPFPCGNSPFGFAIGDVNADGKPDLAKECNFAILSL